MATMHTCGGAAPLSCPPLTTLPLLLPVCRRESMATIVAHAEEWRTTGWTVTIEG